MTPAELAKQAATVTGGRGAQGLALLGLSQSHPANHGEPWEDPTWQAEIEANGPPPGVGAVAWRERDWKAIYDQTAGISTFPPSSGGGVTPKGSGQQRVPPPPESDAHKASVAARQAQLEAASSAGHSLGVLSWVLVAVVVGGVGAFILVKLVRS